jgi:hypothetical protein
VIGKALAVLVLIVAVAFWAVGGWQVYESNTLIGAVLVLAGGMLLIGVISWWRRDPNTGVEAVWQGIIEFFGRA